jgi:hypothetical protein
MAFAGRRSSIPLNTVPHIVTQHRPTTRRTTHMPRSEAMHLGVTVDGTRTTTPSLLLELTTRNATNPVLVTQPNPVGVGIESKSILAPHGALLLSQLDGQLKAPVLSITPCESWKALSSPNSPITPRLIAHRTARL